jgi:hypothetical protein
MQTPQDARTAEAKRLDELALRYRTSRDPEVLAEMRALARRLQELINNLSPVLPPLLTNSLSSNYFQSPTSSFHNESPLASNDLSHWRYTVGRLS